MPSTRFLRPRMRPIPPFRPEPSRQLLRHRFRPPKIHGPLSIEQPKRQGCPPSVGSECQGTKNISLRLFPAYTETLFPKVHRRYLPTLTFLRPVQPDLRQGASAFYEQIRCSNLRSRRAQACLRHGTNIPNILRYPLNPRSNG